MNFGHRPLVSPPSRLGDVDLDATRPARQQLHEQFRLRQHLRQLLVSVSPDDERLRVTSFGVVEGQRDSVLDTEAS